MTARALSLAVREETHCDAGHSHQYRLTLCPKTLQSTIQTTPNHVPPTRGSTTSCTRENARYGYPGRPLIKGRGGMRGTASAFVTVEALEWGSQ